MVSRLQVSVRSSRVLIWLATFGMMAAGVLVYLVDPHLQRFENVPPFGLLNAHAESYGLAVSLHLRNWLPDVAWAALAALFFTELLSTARTRAALSLMIALAAAVSWEVLQGLGLARGVFDVRDLVLSAFAGLAVWGTHRFFIARREIP